MNTRRQVLTLPLSLSLALAACAQAPPPAGPAPRPMNLLILGGTGLIGPHQVRHALARGHRVTLFNRGRRPKDWPAAVEELTGDRETNDYASLKERSWDVCIDNPSSVPHWVRDVAAVLRGKVAHYIAISTLSAYADDRTPGQDESAPLHRYTGPDAMAETMAGLRKNMALYGPLKAAVEAEAMKQFGAACTIVRPGLIAGPGDETDRLSYWPHRLLRGGRVLTPPRVDPVMFIDSRDLGEWTVELAERRQAGVFNAIGPASPLSMGEMLAQMQSALGTRAELVPATPAFLETHKVQAWSDLPVWVPATGETAGFHRRSNARAIAAGLRFRSVAETTTGLMAWWAQQDEKRRSSPLRAGLAPDREAELLKLLEAGHVV